MVFEQTMSGVVDLASALVRIPSVNPDGGDPGTDKTGEAECAAWVADFLSDVGADVSLREVLPGRPNVVGRFPSRREGMPRILFAPHLDTVSVAGMTIDPFGGEVRDGRLFGRGATDTKGTAAAMLWGLRSAQEFLADLPFEVWFAGLVGEEAGQFGAKALAAETRFDFVLAGEPTSLNIVHTHKGSCWLQLRTSGHAVHASQPDAGDNAIYKMASAIDCLRREVLPILASKTDPVLGACTLSVGTIHGGSKVNIVPDFCEAGVDIRIIPGVDPSFVEEMLRNRVPGIAVDLKRSEPLHTDPRHPLIGRLQALGASLAGAPWFCDAAIFAAHGCPSVAIGPGSIAQAHTADEFIALEDLENGAEFFLRFLDSLREDGHSRS
jgi:acetylornithine deacetylase/succinyl-diaminopimelate desuccinylase-like protein